MPKSTKPQSSKPLLPSVVCIGGGTGTFVTLRGLKKHPVVLSAIVSMSDSGGSNKRIRDEFGLLPTSDIRQCFVALSDENGGVGLLRKLFMYRFERGEGIKGMTFGNLFMAALSDIVGSQEEAIRQTGKVLRIKGAVIPVTLTETNLVATYEDGHEVCEEHFIDEPVHDGRMGIVSTRLRPPALANPVAIQAIRNADMVVIGPGDLYTSVIPNLLVDGIPQALSSTKARIIYILNLMTKFGQTYRFSAMDHITTLERYIGKTISTVLVNTSTLPDRALEIYAKYHEEPVIDNLVPSYFHTMRLPLANPTLSDKSDSDMLVRSLIRHDSDKLGEAIMSLLERR